MVSSDNPPLVVENQRRILMSAVISQDGLQTSYEGVSLHDHGSRLIDRVTTRDDVELVASGFQHQGKQYVIHAFSVGDSGELSPWTRNADGTLSRLVAAGSTTRFILIAVSADGSEVYTDDYPLVTVDPMGSSSGQ